jgi:hypothetical protein
MVVVATSSPIEWKIGAELIKVYQNTNFSHCLIVKDGVVYESSHGDTHSMPFEIWRTKNKMINMYFLSDDKVDMEYVVEMVRDDKGYGFGQIFRIAVKYFFGFTIKRNNGNSRLICSEFVGKALRVEWVTDYTSPKEIDDYLKKIQGIK